GRVGRRAAPLDHDVPPLGLLDDVPDQQEVTGEPEAADDAELARELRADLGEQRMAGGVAASHAGVAELLEVALLRLAGGDGVDGEGVAEVGEREGAALG